jgi:hypothetical protein
MAITANVNAGYDPNSPNVTEKYTPLAGIQYVTADQATYSWMLTNRYNILKNLNLIGVDLTLAVPAWATIAAAEGTAGRLPPLVVVSSNRAKWIKGGIDAAATKLARLAIANFANASDLRALTTQHDQTQSPPIYCPTRVGANRGVYIVVQTSEYAFYKKTLAGTNVTVVGYEFDKLKSPRKTFLAGFGASRYAAIEFCKALRTASGNVALAGAGGAIRWDYAWLIDDNVVAVSPFPGLAAVEGVMGANIAAAGLGGKSHAETFASNRDWADDEIAAGRGVQTANMPNPNVPAEILQQMVLWNINYLATNHLNVSPIYVTSAEDTSIQNYLEARNITYRWYGGLGIRKETTTSDGTKFSAQVGAARDKLTKLMADSESAISGTPPPPIEIVTTAVNAQPQVLGLFVDAHVPKLGGDASKQAKAKCQAVEQITSGAIKLGAGYVTAPALQKTFQINGAAGDQTIVRRDQP